MTSDESHQGIQLAPLKQTDRLTGNLRNRQDLSENVLCLYKVCKRIRSQSLTIYHLGITPPKVYRATKKIPTGRLQASRSSWVSRTPAGRFDVLATHRREFRKWRRPRTSRPPTMRSGVVL